MSTRSSGCRTTTTTAWPPRCGPRTSRRPSTRRGRSGPGSCGSTTRSPPPPRCPGAATSSPGSAGSSARTASRTTWRRSPSTSTWPIDSLQDHDRDDPARLPFVVGEPRVPALLLLPDPVALVSLRHPCPGPDGLLADLDRHVGIGDQVVVPVGIRRGPALGGEDRVPSVELLVRERVHTLGAGLRPAVVQQQEGHGAEARHPAAVLAELLDDALVPILHCGHAWLLDRW